MCSLEPYRTLLYSMIFFLSRLANTVRMLSQSFDWLSAQGLQVERVNRAWDFCAFHSKGKVLGTV